MDNPGFYEGKHFSEYVVSVKELVKQHHYDQAEELLISLVEATEEESKAKSQGVAPWYYEQLAILYKKQKLVDKEMTILERFKQQKHAPGVRTLKLLHRLENLIEIKQRQDY